MNDYLNYRRNLKLNGKTEKPKDKKPIARQSEKRKTEQPKYKKIVKEMLAQNPNCEIKSPVCTGKAQGLNHKQKRSPKNLLDKANLERSCNACNLYIEEHPDWAQENGHQISRFKK